MRAPTPHEANLNAINHAATALAIHKRWPEVPIWPVLISVQAVEVLWVVLNFIGVEHTEVGPAFASMRDVHLVHMPYSHSLATTALLAGAVWWVFAKLLSQPRWGIASPKLGTGLYDIPMAALLVETLYGVWCWWRFQGSKALLATILAFNVGALSFYSPDIPGPELFIAGHPTLFAGFIGAHIVMGWVAIWYFARTSWRSAPAALPAP